MISTYGRDDLLCNITKSITPMLVENKVIDKFQYIKKTASSLKSVLSNSKQIALRNKHGHSVPCGKGYGCKNCRLMSGKDYIRGSNGRKFNSAPGDCKSRNIIYAATCQLCFKNYSGKTTQQHGSRNNGHRAKYIRYCKQVANGVVMNLNDLDDEYTHWAYTFTTHTESTMQMGSTTITSSPSWRIATPVIWRERNTPGYRS